VARADEGAEVALKRKSIEDARTGPRAVAAVRAVDLEAVVVTWPARTKAPNSS
jgi:hypothetical protein